MNGTAGWISVKRVYDPPAAGDGRRILVDRLWPRGIPKSEARIDGWYRELAPSSELRKWFGHDPDRWSEFERRYFAELDDNGEKLTELRRLLAKERVTLLFSARDEQHNNAVALRHYLERHHG